MAFNHYLHPVMKRVRRRVKGALKNTEQLAQYRNWWSWFDVYDEATYALHELLPGENEDIQVHRISPRDATALVDERTDGIPKLAGAQVHHFGAFFAADWRRNDILWGRLDAAERIIVVAWPDQFDTGGRDALVAKAQRAIIDETLNDNEYRRLLSRLLEDGTLPKTRPTNAALRDAEVTQVFDGYRKRYAPPPPPDRVSTLELAARAARVTEGVATGLSRDQANPLTSPVGWAGRVLRVIASMIELALNQRPWDIVRNLVNLTVFASIIIIVLGAVIGGAGVVSFGWAVLAATIGLKLLAETIRAWAERKRWWLLPLVLLAASAVLAYEWVKSVDGTRGSIGLVAVGSAAGFLLTSPRKQGLRVLPVVLAVAVLISLAGIGLRHDRDLLVGHVCDANHSWWEDGPKWIPTVTCPDPPKP
jgi:hypothetical protein